MLVRHSWFTTASSMVFSGGIFNLLICPIVSSNIFYQGGCRMGQMTIVGQQQTFDLGKELRSLYIDNLNFIGDTFDPNTVL
jgi:hypothetical protein